MNEFFGLRLNCLDDFRMAVPGRIDRDAGGAVIVTATIPAIKAPTDLIPKTAQVTLRIPAGKSLDGAAVALDTDGKLTEITRRNNEVALPLSK